MSKAPHPVPSEAGPDHTPTEKSGGVLVRPDAPLLQYWQEEGQRAISPEHREFCAENERKVPALIEKVESATAAPGEIIELYRRLGPTNDMQGGANLLLAMANQLEGPVLRDRRDRIVAEIGERLYDRNDALVFAASMRLDAAQSLVDSGQEKIAIPEYIKVARDYLAHQKRGEKVTPEQMAYQFDARVNLAIAIMAVGDKRGLGKLQQGIAKESLDALEKIPKSQRRAGLQTELALQASAHNLVLERANLKFREGKPVDARKLGARKSFKREDEPLDGRRSHQRQSVDLVVRVEDRRLFLQAKTLRRDADVSKELGQHLSTYDRDLVDLIGYHAGESRAILEHLAHAESTSHNVTEDLVRRIQRSRQVAAGLSRAEDQLRRFAA